MANKRHCMNCGGKLKFYGISRQPIEPDAEFKLRWYKCTQCGAMEWRCRPNYGAKMDGERRGDNG